MQCLACLTSYQAVARAADLLDCDSCFDLFILPFAQAAGCATYAAMASTASQKSRSSEGKDNYAGEQIFEVNSHANTAVSEHTGDKSRTLWQNVKKYRKVTYVTFGLTSAILLYGYDNVVVGTVSAMPVFQ